MDVRECDWEGLKRLTLSLGEKPFRARQLNEWLHGKKASSFDEMTDLPATFREKLKAEASLAAIRILDKQESAQTDTCKYLFELSDGNRIESVALRYRHGLSVCISSQVGCRMGCAFCASAIGGLVRNLEASEMLAQVYEITKDKGERVSNVIVMGIGEPLDNYDALIRFLRMANREDGLGISQRNLTVSTCGMLDNIERLSKERLQITLAVSLHAPNDEIRKKLMAVAKRESMEDLLKTCRQYKETTGRRVTFEYAMIRGVNDRKECAIELVGRLAGMACHVNLIPLNEVKEREFRASDKKTIQEFKKILEKNRINVTIRRGMGEDIMAACGQLRKLSL